VGESKNRSDKATEGGQGPNEAASSESVPPVASGSETCPARAEQALDGVPGPLDDSKCPFQQIALELMKAASASGAMVPQPKPSVPAVPSVPAAQLTSGETHEQALNEFFVSPEEMEVLGDFSVDVYRDQVDTRLMADGVQEYLSFGLASELFAVNIIHIKEIIKVPMITEVPRVEAVILGILSLRGTIVPVADLRRRLGLPCSPSTRKSRVLIVQMSEDDYVGLLVDEVRHVIRLKDTDIEPPPGVFDRAEAEHILGVGRDEGEFYTLLDLDSLVDIDRFLKVSGSK